MSGRFDGKKKTSTTYRLGIGFFVLIFVMITVFSLLGDGTKNDEMCAELTIMMLNDSEHDRLHNDYPALMIELHQFLLKSCNDIEDDMAIQINNPDRITINVGEP